MCIIYSKGSSLKIHFPMQYCEVLLFDNLNSAVEECFRLLLACVLLYSWMYMIMNYIIIEKELHINHLALIVAKNNSFVCVTGEDKMSYLTPVFLCLYHNLQKQHFLLFL